MSKSHTIDIDRIANLARLELTEAEKERFKGELEKILIYFDKIDAVDTTGYEPMSHPFTMFNVWEDDEPRETLDIEEVLLNAPKSQENQFLVPKVVE